MRVRYPDTPTAAIARTLARSEKAVWQRARFLGLSKSHAYLSSASAGRIQRGDHKGREHWFPKGHVPANKGVKHPKGWAPGRMRDGQFKKGQRSGVAVTLYKPIGTERISKDGYLERKINDDFPANRRWRAVHLLVWEAAHGPLPKGHAVAFLNGDKSDIRLDNLELVTRAELMRRNTVHNLPAPLPQMVQLLGALNRQINKRTRNSEEQDRGSQEPSLCRAGRSRGQGQPDGAGAGEGDRGRRARDRGQRESGSRVLGRNGSDRRLGLPGAAGRAGAAASAPRLGRRSVTIRASRVRRAHA